MGASGSAYAWFGLAVTVLVTLAVVAAILLFERRRAQAIDRDLREHRNDGQE
jgi:hypothetical protein